MCRRANTTEKGKWGQELGVAGTGNDWGRLQWGALPGALQVTGLNI